MASSSHGDHKAGIWGTPASLATGSSRSPGSRPCRDRGMTGKARKQALMRARSSIHPLSASAWVSCGAARTRSPRPRLVAGGSSPIYQRAMVASDSPVYCPGVAWVQPVLARRWQIQIPKRRNFLDRPANGMAQLSQAYPMRRGPPRSTPQSRFTALSALSVRNPKSAACSFNYSVCCPTRFWRVAEYEQNAVRMQ